MVEQLRISVLVLLAVEGFLVIVGATYYVTHQLNAITQHRKALFTVFLAIPNSFLRSLASRSTSIGDEESSDEENGEQTIRSLRFSYVVGWAHLIFTARPSQ